MNKKQLRIAVAKDVIKQLQRKAYKASPGTYCRMTFIPTQELVVGLELKDQIDKAVQCEVCAVGSAFLSLVKIDNKFVTTHGTNVISYARAYPPSDRQTMIQLYRPDERAMRNRLEMVFSKRLR